MKNKKAEKTVKSAHTSNSSLVLPWLLSTQVIVTNVTSVFAHFMKFLLKAGPQLVHFSPGTA